MDVIQIIAAFAAVTAAFLAGVIKADAKERQRAIDKVDNAGLEMTKNIKAMADVHNSLAHRFTEMQDQLNSHEMRLTGVMGKTTPWPTAREMTGPASTEQVRAT